MKNGFLGTSRHTLENGNRIIIPSSFRNLLSPEFVLFKSVEGCLSIYDTETFDSILDEVNSSTDTHEGRIKARKFARAARICSLDKQGRFTIPADYIAFASLGNTVYLSGLGSHLEIWDEEVFLLQEAEDFDPAKYPGVRYL